MCRLYGFRSNEATKVECSLVHAQNALLVQSQQDEIGRKHPDGWGIGYFDNDQPKVERSSLAAFEGLHFSNAAERTYSTSVISHVRLATVGTPKIENCHPFQWGKWIFAHNGTVSGVDQLRDKMMDELTSLQRESVKGTTDSELMFHWIINRLVRDEAVDSKKCLCFDRIVDGVSESIVELDRRCREAQPDQPAKLNLILSDGRIMIACRIRNSLCWVHRNGIRDCEICGIPHVDHQPGKKYRAVIIASEQISHEKWDTIPDGSLVAVDSNVCTMTRQILGSKLTSNGMNQ